MSLLKKRINGGLTITFITKFIKRKIDTDRCSTQIFMIHDITQLIPAHHLSCLYGFFARNQKPHPHNKQELSVMPLAMGK